MTEFLRRLVPAIVVVLMDNRIFAHRVFVLLSLFYYRDVLSFFSPERCFPRGRALSSDKPQGALGGGEGGADGGVGQKPEVSGRARGLSAIGGDYHEPSNRGQASEGVTDR